MQDREAECRVVLTCMSEEFRRDRVLFDSNPELVCLLRVRYGNRIVFEITCFFFRETGKKPAYSK